jgi:DNA-binding CsgD family transcriptional regulator
MRKNKLPTYEVVTQAPTPEKATRALRRVKSASRYKRVYLGDRHPGIYLTEQEAKCMYYFLQGMSESLAGQAMGLSSRTVNFYSSNVRMKLGCKSRKELVTIIRQTDFHEQLLKIVMN